MAFYSPLGFVKSLFIVGTSSGPFSRYSDCWRARTLVRENVAAPQSVADADERMQCWVDVHPISYLCAHKFAGFCNLQYPFLGRS